MYYIDIKKKRQNILKKKKEIRTKLTIIKLL